MSECKYCKKESYGRPFCPACAEKYFNMKLPAIEQKRSTEAKPNRIKTNEFVHKCKLCNNQVYKQSDYCYRHFHEQYYYEKENEPKTSIYQPKREKYYKSLNGTTTRSKSECLICDFLTIRGIEFEYESPLYYSRHKAPLKPDFYIKGPCYLNNRLIKNVYIEHLGGLEYTGEKGEEYKEILRYKLPIYDALGITLICTFEHDMENYNDALTYKLTNYVPNTINY